MYIHQINGALNISRKYIVKPYNLDDLCYILYSLFKERAVSIAYEKPSCSHMFIVGGSYEIRLHVTASCEVRLSILIDVDMPLTSSSLRYVYTIFSDIDRSFSRLCDAIGGVYLSLRTALWIKKANVSLIEKLLTELGVVVYAKESHIISDIAITIIRGRIIGKDLRLYDITVTLLYNSMAEINISIETEVDSENVFDRLIDIQTLLYTIVEYMAYNLGPSISRYMRLMR